MVGKKPLVKYPDIVIDLHKIDNDMFSLLGKIHGQMKNKIFSKKQRAEFTNALYALADEKTNIILWEDVINETRKWVTIKKEII